MKDPNVNTGSEWSSWITLGGTVTYSLVLCVCNIEFYLINIIINFIIIIFLFLLLPEGTDRTIILVLYVWYVDQVTN